MADSSGLTIAKVIARLVAKSLKMLAFLAVLSLGFHEPVMQPVQGC
jgi:hypothetical protein